MIKGKFITVPDHKGLVALLYYSGVRISEVLRAVREQFYLKELDLLFNVGPRLKRKDGLITPPLNFPLEAPYVGDIWATVKKTQSTRRVFPYCRKTGYNIVRRVFEYPHYFRLSRITWFFDQGFTLAEVHSWTGLSLKALEFYIGIVKVKKMGKSLGKS